VTYEPQFGTLDMNADGSFTYTPDEQYCNTMNGGRPDYFIYEVCTAAGCESMSVNIIVECGELIVFTGFSPNGDGINDFFRIDGLQQYDDHKVAIYNRWGNVVFTSKDYNNDWYGTNDGNGLPDGTYFYVIEVDGAQEMGYVQIAR
jgi:gliding motility-associated-like protein